MSSDLMIDSEEMNVFWEPWTLPSKMKRKKKSKKDRKQKNKTDGSAEKKKKKKSSKCKEPAERKKEKRKGNKKSALALDLEGESVVIVKRRCTENPETQDFKKETKRKKTVAFDLSPEHNHVKPPKFVFCSLQSPEESAGAVGVGENHPQVTAPDQNQNQSQPINDSQCPSDDVQSQDLFITQRMFRSPVSQTSSSESSDKAGVSTSTQRHKHTPAVKTESQDPCFYQRNATSKKNTLEALFSLEEDDDDKTDAAIFQTQKGSNTKHAKYKPASRHLSIEPKAVNPFLDAPTVVDDAKIKKPSTVMSVFTQTENFFTTELSSYLSFCQKNKRSSGHSEDVKPLDLRLPNRVRKDHDGGLETSDIEIQDDQDGGFKSSQEPHLKDVGGRRGSHSGRLSSGSVGGRGQKTPSSESESRSAETTGSSEDMEAPCRTNRLDLMQFQVRAVQMRLNESFYFRAKGEGYSPRPASPLMKLTQSRDLKSKKRN